jgi:hypothetical protein
VQGLKVFNFHPIHIFENTHSQAHYREIKQHYQNPAELEKHRAKRGLY